MGDNKQFNHLSAYYAHRKFVIWKIYSWQKECQLVGRLTRRKIHSSVTAFARGEFNSWWADQRRYVIRKFISFGSIWTPRLDDLRTKGAIVSLFWEWRSNMVILSIHTWRSCRDNFITASEWGTEDGPAIIIQEKEGLLKVKWDETFRYLLCSFKI